MSGWREYSVKPASGGFNVIYALIAGLLIGGVATLFMGAGRWLYVGQDPSIAFEYWRLVTYAFTTNNLLQLALNALVMWFLVRGLERELGAKTIITWFLLAGLGGATALVLFGPPAALGGALAGIFGLVAGFAVIKHKARMDIRADIAFLTIFVIWGLVSGAGDWMADIGAIAVGAGAGAVHAYTPWNKRKNRLVPGYVAVAAVCLLLVTLRWMRIL